MGTAGADEGRDIGRVDGEGRDREASQLSRLTGLV